MICRWIQTFGDLVDIQAQAVGALIVDAGVAVNMNYGNDDSGAYMTNAKAALVKTFQYQNAVVTSATNLIAGCVECDLTKMINPNLDAGLPVLLGIYGDMGGHAIVVDGYGYSFSTLYHHLNMGWSGLFNAWYALPVIDMYFPETGLYTNFWQVTDCLYNVYPNGNGEIISGRVIDVFGDPVVDADVTATRVGGGTYEAFTDGNGIYALAGIPSASTYIITVTDDGYFPASSNFVTGVSLDNTNCGNLWGANFTLVPAEGPPFITVQPQNQSATLGASATFSLTSVGQMPLSYQWQYQPAGSLSWYNLSDGDNYGGTATATLTVTPSDITDYNGESLRCIVTNALGSATSSQAVLSVNTYPYLTIVTMAGLAGSNGSADSSNSAARFTVPAESRWTTTPMSMWPTCTITLFAS